MADFGPGSEISFLGPWGGGRSRVFAFPGAWPGIFVHQVGVCVKRFKDSLSGSPAADKTYDRFSAAFPGRRSNLRKILSRVPRPPIKPYKKRVLLDVVAVVGWPTDFNARCAGKYK